MKQYSREITGLIHNFERNPCLTEITDKTVINWNGDNIWLIHFSFFPFEALRFEVLVCLYDKNIFIIKTAFLTSTQKNNFAIFLNNTFL